MNALFRVVPGLLGFVKDSLGGLLGWAEGAAKDNPKSALGAGVLGASFFDPSYWQGVFKFIAAVAQALAPLVK